MRPRVGRRRVARLRSAVHKLGWGLRTVGPAATAIGVVRYGSIRLRRPAVTVLPIRSGGELEVAVPTQMITALAVFGDVIDPEYDVIRRVMRPDTVVVDVGAGVGQFSVFAARHGAGVVHAVEPDDANVAMLHRNVVRNAVAGRVTTHRIAFGDHSGTGSLVVSSGVPARSFNGRIVPVDADGSGVPVRRLDDWVAGLGLERVGIVKVNVAGGESDVLAGGGRLFDEQRVDLLVVLIGVEVVGALEALAALGYRWFLPDPRHGALFECRRFDRRFLTRRPFPARHVVGVSEPAVASGLLDGFGLVTSW